MPKSLGQIHTVNEEFNITGAGTVHTVDSSKLLSEQLSRLIRQSQNFKLTGIDLTVDDRGSGVGGGQISGKIRYWSPTRGRVAAYKGAYKAMAQAMKLQGISMSKNKAYDFKVAFNSQNTALDNTASLDGVHALCMTNPSYPSPDPAQPVSRANICGVHNASITNTTAAFTGFPSGFNTMGVQNTPTDFVLNDAAASIGNPLEANQEWEELPFQLTYDPATDNLVTNFMWRPDPQLYVSVMLGLVQFYIEEVEFDGGVSALNLNVALHFAGWKTFMGTYPSKGRQSNFRAYRRRWKKK